MVVDMPNNSESGWPLRFYRISTTKKNPNIDQLSTTQHLIDRKSYLKSAHLHYLLSPEIGKMRDKGGLFQLGTFRKALGLDHTALCRP